MSVILWGIVDLIVQAVAWGTVGYFAFRAVGVKAEYWYRDCLAVCIAVILWDVWSCSLLIDLDLSVGNREILNYIGDDLTAYLEFDYISAGILIAQVLAGYKLGEYLLGKLKSQFAIQQPS